MKKTTQDRLAYYRKIIRLGQAKADNKPIENDSVPSQDLALNTVSPAEIYRGFQSSNRVCHDEEGGKSQDSPPILPSNMVYSEDYQHGTVKHYTQAEIAEYERLRDVD